MGSVLPRLRRDSSPSCEETARGIPEFRILLRDFDCDRIERKSRNPAPLFDPTFTRAFTRERDFFNLWKMGDGESEILVSRKETCLSNHCGVPRMVLLRKI